MTEKRKFHRWPCSFSCDLYINSRRFRGIITDMSYGGARVVNATALPEPGVSINLTIYLNDSEEKQESEGTSLRAQVTHVSDEDFCFGVQFSNNSGDLGDQLSSIIDEKLVVYRSSNYSL